MNFELKFKSEHNVTIILQSLQLSKNIVFTKINKLYMTWITFSHQSKSSFKIGIK